MYEDRALICRDCGNEFVFTVGEQQFFAEKNFLNDPVRCPDCRQLKKQRRREKISHPDVCADCGRDFILPFVPTKGDPVYCEDCLPLHREQAMD